MALNTASILRAVEPALYSPRGRRLSAGFLLATTVLMLVQALRLQPDASFDKTIPVGHPYMQVFDQYRVDLGGADALLVALMQREKAGASDIYNETFLASLKLATTEVEFTRGVDRTRLSSIFTRNVRYLEVVDGGFRSEDVIPAKNSRVLGRLMPKALLRLR